MSKVIFDFEGREVIIQCTKDEKMNDICQRYVNKINRTINSLIFLYNGKQLNFNLNFNEQANTIDKERNIMKVLILRNEDNNEYICPKCGEKIKINIKDDIILSINNIKDVINGIKFNLDNIIEKSKDNFISIQLKNINLVINTLNDDIKKINEKMNDLLNNNKEIKNDNINNLLNNNIIINDNINNNYIISEIVIIEEDINKNIRIINSYEEYMREHKHNDIMIKEFKNEEEIKKCEIKINDKLIPFNYFYKFKSKGKYRIIYTFTNNINNTGYIFSECSKLAYIDLSNFNTKNVTYMRRMFSGCYSLTNINLSNFNTNKVIDMSGMFNECSGLTNIDLSNFNTNNVTDMSCMFSGCSGLTKINLSNFITNNVTDMSCMFYGCENLTKKNTITKDKKLLNNIDG